MSVTDHAPVLLFDGDCGLCNRIVRLLLRTDQAGRLRFAPLQGKAGQAYLRLRGLPTDNFDSLVFVPDWAAPDRCVPLLRTDGVLAAAAEIGGIWRLVTWLRVLPGWLRDPFYRLVARTRYALFGRYRGEPPGESAEWRGRFL
jgi:predicted DCC family thiol-disulfide oxidoreductase YuxK